VGRVTGAERFVLDVRVRDPIPAGGRIRIEGNQVKATDPASPPDPVPAEVNGEWTEGNAVENNWLGHHPQDLVGPPDLNGAELGLELSDLSHPLGWLWHSERGWDVFDPELLDLPGQGIDVGREFAGQPRESQNQFFPGGQVDLVSDAVSLGEPGVECSPG
jgi:hypothetical protein